MKGRVPLRRSTCIPPTLCTWMVTPMDVATASPDRHACGTARCDPSLDNAVSGILNTVIGVQGTRSGVVLPIWPVGNAGNGSCLTFQPISVRTPETGPIRRCVDSTGACRAWYQGLLAANGRSPGWPSRRRDALAGTWFHSLGTRPFRCGSRRAFPRRSRASSPRPDLPGTGISPPSVLPNRSGS